VRGSEANLAERAVAPGAVAASKVVLTRPEQVSPALAEALEGGDLDVAASFFAREACFLTPDATAIRGREDIRPILAQLIASRVQIRIEVQSTLVAGDMAIATERWTMHTKGTGAEPFVQTSGATVLLRHLERTWKLMIVAPWGLRGADLHRFA
jgi:ketosteroid isomerase-like protein